MLRTASSLPHTGLLTLGSDPARFPAGPPACYRASWQLPGPDFHRQATTSLRTPRNTMALRHGVTSRSAGRTKRAHRRVGIRPPSRVSLRPPGNALNSARSRRRLTVALWHSGTQFTRFGAASCSHLTKPGCRQIRRQCAQLSGDLRAVGRSQQSRLQPDGRSASRIFIHRRA